MPSRNKFNTKCMPLLRLEHTNKYFMGLKLYIQTQQPQLKTAEISSKLASSLNEHYKSCHTCTGWVLLI